MTCVPSRFALYRIYVYRPVLPCIVYMCTVQCALAAYKEGPVLEMYRPVLPCKVYMCTVQFALVAYEFGAVLEMNHQSFE